MFKLTHVFTVFLAMVSFLPFFVAIVCTNSWWQLSLRIVKWCHICLTPFALLPPLYLLRTVLAWTFPVFWDWPNWCDTVVTTRSSSYRIHQLKAVLFAVCVCVCVCVCCVLSCFSHVQLFVTLSTIARQAPLYMGFSRQEYWSGLPVPSSRGCSQLWDQTCVSCISYIGRWVLYH